MSAMVILPTSIVYPNISTLEIGSHFMCECAPGEDRGHMAVYQIVSYNSDIFKSMGYKIPAVNCSTGCMRIFSPDTKVIPAKMVLAPQDMVKITDKNAIFAR